MATVCTQSNPCRECCGSSEAGMAPLASVHGYTVVVYGDSFARNSPRMAELEAKKLVERAFGQAAPVEKQCIDDALYALAEKGVGYCRKHESEFRGVCPACGDEKQAHAKCDPMERYVDGLTVRECLERFELNQRDAAYTNPSSFLIGRQLTAAQKDTARLAWSAELKRKQEQAKESRRVEVVCERDEDGL